MTARAAVKRAIGTLALGPGFASRTRRALRGRLNVVYLHFVGDSKPYYAEFYAGSTIDRLDAHLTELGRHFEFCSLEEVLRIGQADAADQKPPLAVTFDDGFDLLANGAADVLEQHGVKATTFVITSTLDNADLMWRNKLSAIRALRDESVYVARYNDLVRTIGVPGIRAGATLMPASELWPMDRKDELAEELWASCDMPRLEAFLEEYRPYFTWAGLRDWISRGHSVGLHTASHPFCSRIPPGGHAIEIIEPAALLRTTLELDFLPLSYPFGARLDAESERDLYERGVFDCAFGIEGFAARGTAPFRLERASVEGDLAFPVFGKPLLGLPKAAR
jgi:peptidoglycan/xylan/chitin deacetylase (PgdA/CDA1 family)